MAVTLRNPHSILAVLKARPQDITQISLPKTSQSGDAWSEIAKLAQEKRVRAVQGSAGGGARPQQGGRDRGENKENREGYGEANVKEREGISAEELFQGASDRAGGKGLWLALDSLQDPHNVGAIFRSAAFFGVEGILLTQERSAPLTGTVYDVAAGGVDSIPFALQTNLQHAFKLAKDAGLWILGTSEHAKEDLSAIKRDRPWLLVLGNEEKGLRRLTQDSCDVLCAVKPKGEVTSLNVSVAAGVCIAKLTGALG